MKELNQFLWIWVNFLKRCLHWQTQKNSEENTDGIIKKPCMKDSIVGWTTLEILIASINSFHEFSFYDFYSFLNRQ